MCDKKINARNVKNAIDKKLLLVYDIIRERNVRSESEKQKETYLTLRKK